MTVTVPEILPQPVHEIHVSEIKEFKKCRTAHNFKFEEQFYPHLTAKPLEFGTAYHAAKEVYFNPETWPYPESVRGHLAKLKFIEVSEGHRNALIEQFGSLDPAQQEDYDERLALGIGMLTHYFENISPQEDAWFVPIAVEQNFSVPIYDNDGYILRCKCAKCAKKWQDYLDVTPLNVDLHGSEWMGLEVRLEGKIDAIVKDKRTGKIWIVDWKTTANIAKNHEWLELDEQLLFYCVAVQLILKVDVAGFLYHEQRKGYPLPPKKNKTRRLGKLFSVAKDQDTDYDLYLDTVRLEDEDAYNAGYYDEFLEFLETEGITYFERTSIRKNNEQLKLAQQDLYAVAVEIINPNKTVYPSPGKFNCGYCAFQQVCVGRATLGDYTYTLNTQFERRQHYYEERTTDK